MPAPDDSTGLNVGPERALAGMGTHQSCASATGRPTVTAMSVQVRDVLADADGPR
jgi:hypothetical protein